MQRRPEGPSRDLSYLTLTEEAMGSSFAIVMYGAEPAQLEKAAAAAFDELHRLDDMLSNYKPGSEWSRVNREGPAGPVVISPELFALLSKCLEFSRRSDGAFDITVGPLMKVWGFYRGEGARPRPEEVSRSLGRVGHRYVRLDSEAMTVTFLRAGVELDPGGIGKGYAVDRMVDVLKRHGVDRALVSAGSSIYGLGTPPRQPSGWRITVAAPARSRGRSVEVDLKDMSLSTSGTDEKFFQVDGQKYSHIIDPRTGHPARGVSSVSVMAPRTIESEAWTKPYFINGLPWARAQKRTDVRVFWCADSPAGPCDWLR